MKQQFLFLFLIPIAGLAQSANITGSEAEVAPAGIHFESTLSWSEIQAKAKAENKFIFMDCYATWCGPCKFMSERIFTQKEVGDYMNAHFINVALQTDRTSKDDEDIRKWYDDARAIVDRYSINTFPTYLFFSPDGQPLHRIVGVTGKEAEDFILKVKNAFDPNMQYYNYIGNYKMHLSDSTYLRKALTMSLNAGDLKNAETISDSYVSCLPDPFREYNLRLISKAIQSTKDKGFDLFLKNASRIDSVFDGDPVAEDRVWRVIADEEISPLFSRENFPIIWKDLSATLSSKYPGLNAFIKKSLYSYFESKILITEIRLPLYKTGTAMADWNEIFHQMKLRYPGYDAVKMITIEKPRYYVFKKMWPECEKSALSCAKKYGNQLTKDQLNTLAWDCAFMHSTNRKFLLKAAEWSLRTIPGPNDTLAYNHSSTYEFIDTYANLLYKLGERDKAIFWENKALELAKKFQDGTEINYKITLERMEKGENTWEGRDSRFEEYQ